LAGRGASSSHGRRNNSMVQGRKTLIANRLPFLEKREVSRVNKIRIRASRDMEGGDSCCDQGEKKRMARELARMNRWRNWDTT